MEDEYITRTSTESLVDTYLEPFIGTTLLKAADYLADLQGIDLPDLIQSVRPISIWANHPHDEGEIKYSFAIGVEENMDVALDNSDICGLQYTLRRTESEMTPFSSLTAQQQATVIERLTESGGYDEDFIDILRDPTQQKLQAELKCELELVTEYICYESSLTSMKTVGVNYYFADECIMSIGVDAGVDSGAAEDEGVDGMYDPALPEEDMDISIPGFADIDTMQEILYHLNLPGGVIKTDVTSEYID